MYREFISILRGVEKLNIVGADIVEVSPAFDGVGEQTALAAAQVVYEMITSAVKKETTERGLHSAIKEVEFMGKSVGMSKDEL